MKVLECAAFAVMVSSSSAHAQLSAQALADRLLSEVDAPGVGVATLDNGVVDVGVAGVRAVGSSVPITPDDQWHIGSDTKSMTATLIARLVEQGRMRWDMTIGEVLGTQAPDMNPAYASVTVRNLLEHRSGLPANVGFVTSMKLAGSLANRNMLDDRLEYARAVLARRPVHDPGTAFLYSNAGYVVVGAMAQALTGESWEAAMRREVFAPLGMRSAGFGAPGEGGTLTQPRGHSRTLIGGVKAIEPGPEADNVPALGPAGTVHVNLRDLVRYLAAHLGAGPAGYLSEESWRALQTPRPGSDYALGWGVTPDGALTHAGSNTMWFVQIWVWPERNRALVLAANYGVIENLAIAFAQAAEAFETRI